MIFSYFNSADRLKYLNVSYNFVPFPGKIIFDLI